MPKVYDDAMKKLLRANAQDFVSLILKGARVERLLPTELDPEHIHADGLIECLNANGKKTLVHFEFQSGYDEHIGERVLEYSVFASRLNDYIPVESGVIYLKRGLDWGKREVPSSPFIKRSDDGKEIIIFHYKVICLWKMTVEDLLKTGLLGFLPLLPLAADGKHRHVIDIMIAKLVEAKATNLLWTAYALSAKTLGPHDQHWLKRRFSVFSDFLRDSPVYQEAVEEGRAVGGQQTASRILVDLIRGRFPALETVAIDCVSKIDDADILSRLIVEISGARSEARARKVLESYLNA